MKIHNKKIVKGMTLIGGTITKEEVSIRKIKRD